MNLTRFRVTRFRARLQHTLIVTGTTPSRDDEAPRAAAMLVVVPVHETDSPLACFAVGI